METTYQRLFVAEFRTDLVGGPHRRMSGHAGVFGSVADVGKYWERIDTHAFDGALQRPDDVRFLLNHNPDNLLGRTGSGTLQLTTTDKGLQVNNELPDTTLGRDVQTLIERGDLTGMSFGFKPTSHQIGYAPDGRQLRTVMTLELFDVSLATFPAYSDTNDVVLRTVDWKAEGHVRIDRTSQMIRARSRLLKGKS
jgi:HK97 family phage prohead protease